MPNGKHLQGMAKVKWKIIKKDVTQTTTNDNSDS